MTPGIECANIVLFAGHMELPDGNAMLTPVQEAMGPIDGPGVVTTHAVLALAGSPGYRTNLTIALLDADGSRYSSADVDEVLLDGFGNDVEIFEFELEIQREGPVYVVVLEGDRELARGRVQAREMPLG